MNTYNSDNILVWDHNGHDVKATQKMNAPVDQNICNQNSQHIQPKYMLYQYNTIPTTTCVQTIQSYALNVVRSLLKIKFIWNYNKFLSHEIPD